MSQITIADLAVMLTAIRDEMKEENKLIRAEIQRKGTETDNAILEIHGVVETQYSDTSVAIGQVADSLEQKFQTAIEALKTQQDQVIQDNGHSW